MDAVVNPGTDTAVLASSEPVNRTIEICPEFAEFMQSMPTPISIDTIITKVEPWDGVSEFESGKAYALTYEQAKIVYADKPEVIRGIEEAQNLDESNVKEAIAEKIGEVCKILVMNYDNEDFPEPTGVELTTVHCSNDFWVNQEMIGECFGDVGVLKFYWWTHNPYWPLYSGERILHWHYALTPNSPYVFTANLYYYTGNARTIYTMFEDSDGNSFISQNCEVNAPDDTLGHSGVECIHGVEVFGSSGYFHCP
jgi:hypothetical protein